MFKSHQVRHQKIHQIKMFFFVAFILFLMTTLLLVKNLLMSFILALVMYYLLVPFVNFLEKKGFSRSLASGLIFTIMTLLTGLFFPLLFGSFTLQFETLKNNFPKYQSGSNELLVRLQSEIQNYAPDFHFSKHLEDVQNFILNYLQTILKSIPDYISSSLTIVFLSMFFGYFLMSEGPAFIRRIMRLVPNKYFELAIHLQHEISTQMGSFIRARLLESLMITLMIWTGLFIMDFPYALILALLSGLLNLIPYVGPIIAAIPAYIILLINGGQLQTALALTLVFVFAQVIDTGLIVPFFVAKIVNLHPITVVLAILVGSQFMGLLGMVISIPLASALKVTVTAIYQHLTQNTSE